MSLLERIFKRFVMKKKIINITIAILIFSLGYWIGSKQDDNKNNDHSGTYLYEIKDILNVQTDSYFTIDSINKKYDYYNENNQYKGEIQEVEEDLYLLVNGNLDMSVISFENDKIILIEKNGKVQEVYKFSNTLTEKN